MNKSEVIILNVGGTKFATFPATLRKCQDSKLARMLEGGDTDIRLVNGQFFVDRDGSLFSYILDFLRTCELTLPPDFSDYNRLAREADFYDLPSLVDLLNQDRLKHRPEILEVRFSLQETYSFFRLFCSCNSTIETLADRIVVYAEQPGENWNHSFSAQKSMTSIQLQRPSHHDLVFHCGTDYSAGDTISRYVSIYPDQRKLMNGNNVLGLLVDILLREGFRLISTRTISPKEKVECYTFERTRRNELLTISEQQGGESVNAVYFKSGKSQSKRK